MTINSSKTNWALASQTSWQVLAAQLASKKKQTNNTLSTKEIPKGVSTLVNLDLKVAGCRLRLPQIRIIKSHADRAHSLLVRRLWVELLTQLALTTLQRGYSQAHWSRSSLTRLRYACKPITIPTIVSSQTCLLALNGMKLAISNLTKASRQNQNRNLLKRRKLRRLRRRISLVKWEVHSKKW